ncbi:SDR family NAD(P)-dependent oxidoreductase [Arthrobacter sp. TWP1-1]|uniref:SDR family NAD(P)-dependent oxidoreductase n=1 Tax=Arthrobacter sp. TWP1-1 TaxID=2804568 RepID=UPI003CF8A29B
MSHNPNNISGESTIKAWLADPAGGPVLRAQLAQGGQSAEDLRPVSKLSLNRLVEVSQGAFTQDMVDTLVQQLEAGDIPAEVAPAAAEPAEPSVEAPVWVEKVTTGRFSGKTVIITGAGSGIGRATASRVAREGGRVIAVDISEERLTDFAASLPEGDIVTVSGDITDDDAVAAIVAAAGERIDGLANIAGIMDNMTPIHEVSDDIWNRVFNINVNGTMKLMRAVVPAMLAQAQGSIVNVASEAALRGSAAGAAYTASKHAVAGLTKSSAFMYGPSGIRVNAVAPGPVITNIEARFDSALGSNRVRRAMAILPDPVEGDALAASITFLLSDDGVNVNGVILPSDGGWSAA